MGSRSDDKLVTYMVAFVFLQPVGGVPNCLLRTTTCVTFNLTCLSAPMARLTRYQVSGYIHVSIATGCIGIGDLGGILPPNREFCCK